MRVLVAGATGHQGGHVARLLLKKGHSVVGLTRKADSDAAKQLIKLGASVTVGDLADKASIEKAAKDVDAIFGVTNYDPRNFDAQGEIQQGINLADTAKKLDKYLVFSSVAHADRKTGVPHFDSKGEIEKHIKKIGLNSVTVLGPLAFMENIFSFSRDSLKQGIFSNLVSANTKVGHVCAEDIAQMAVLALENPKRFAGKRIDIGGDYISGEETVAVLSKIIGKPIKYQRIPIEAIRSTSEDLALMGEYFENKGFTVDVAQLRKDYPEVQWHSYEDWAKSQNWDQFR